MCVQRFDDSLNSAIHITYRNSLRSSSMREPRDPLLKVVLHDSTHSITSIVVCKMHRHGCLPKVHRWIIGFEECTCNASTSSKKINNDPSAGSPTETLLRLLLPLNDQV
jgi:hypothetical protein